MPKVIVIYGNRCAWRNIQVNDIPFIERDGKREYATVPMEIFVRLVRYPDKGDVMLYGKAKTVHDDVRTPGEVAKVIIDGVNPVKAWRKRRGLPQQNWLMEPESARHFSAK